VTVKRAILPRHKRHPHPPTLRLTERDIQVVLAVHEYRVLRRDQIQRLHFPSRNTANERLKRLYQHRFLERRWLPVEYGQGAGQAIYLLDQRGADLAADRQGVDRGALGWSQARNQVRLLFLQHQLMVNDARIAFALAAQRAGYRIERWLGQEALAAHPDRVPIVTANGSERRLALIPDGYFVLNLGNRRSHFFLEVDRGTLPNRRWRQRMQGYLAYVASGAYSARYRTHSLRVLVITTGARRAENLKRATEGVGGGRLFWFTTLDQAQPEAVLGAPIWQVAGQTSVSALIQETTANLRQAVWVESQTNTR
jgi:hypothetical protein